MKFRKRSTDATAIQFNESNYHECLKFVLEKNGNGVNKIAFYYDIESNVMKIEIEWNSGRILYVHRNYWVVRDDRDEIFSVAPDAFDEKYMTVEGQHHEVP